ncbi:MAG: NTP transferase domain-containing protein [Lachnospiraceae bacterium]|nr:NTP transferase domain-containing protein [Lachnospiraceae bacterium]
MYKVDNAIILAAGTSSRFAPLSYERHKALTVVRGEVLIERQIRQLIQKDIREIYVITGYKAEQFEYLKEKFGVELIYNPYYLNRNNNSSIYVAKDYIKNSYICSADNYFIENPFEKEVDFSYYAVVYSKEMTDEWCISTDNDGYINSVSIGGSDSWYMYGQVFWDNKFSKKFLDILESVYKKEETYGKLWEEIFIAHLDTLKMRIKKYPNNFIFEFDTLDELRKFDVSYINNTRSSIIKKIAEIYRCNEAEIVDINSYYGNNYEAIGITFNIKGKRNSYIYDEKL